MSSHQVILIAVGLLNFLLGYFAGIPAGIRQEKRRMVKELERWATEADRLERESGGFDA